MTVLSRSADWIRFNKNLIRHGSDLGGTISENMFFFIGWALFFDRMKIETLSRLQNFPAHGDLGSINVLTMNVF